MFDPLPSSGTGTVYLGIDPGVSGAIAILDSTGGVVAVEDFPTITVASTRTRHSQDENQVKTKRTVRGTKTVLNEDAIARSIERIGSFFHVALCTIERVGPMPRDGAISSFSFGFSTGLLHGILAGLKVPRVLVHPTVWKRAFELPADKEAVRQATIRRWPVTEPYLTRRKDHGRADALWLARYGWRNPR